MITPERAAAGRPDEARRLAAIEALGLLSPYIEDGMTRVVRLAAQVTGLPSAGFSLVGQHEQWFKASVGVPYTRSPRATAFCAHAIASSRPLVVADARRDPRFRDSPVVAGPPGVRFYAGTAVRDLEGYAVGTLCVLDTAPHRLSARRLAGLEDLAALLERELWLKALTVLDPLTGLYNRRFLDDYAGWEWRRARRDLAPVSVLMFDLDQFGAYNRERGHDAGDHALRAVAHTLRAAMHRGGDIVARYGGEEFVVVLPRTDSAGALAVAERVRAAVQGLGIAHPTAQAGCLTLSAGVATMASGQADSLAAMLGRADAALFAAKAAGRNQTRAAPSRGA